MSFDAETSYKGLTLGIVSDTYSAMFGGTGGEVVGFFIRDPKTITAIKERDEKILDALNWMIDEINFITAGRDPNYLPPTEKAMFDYMQSDEGFWGPRGLPEKSVCRRAPELTAKQAKQLYITKRRSQFGAKRQRLFLALIERDGLKCTTCGSTKHLEVDHIKPLSKGGPDDLSNLQILCGGCNRRKKDS